MEKKIKELESVNSKYKTQLAHLEEEIAFNEWKKRSADSELSKLIPAYEELKSIVIHNEEEIKSLRGEVIKNESIEQDKSRD